MKTRQQKEALAYFKKHAQDWRAKAMRSPNADVNVIQQRNDYVLRIAGEHPSTKSFLDVGCGTGELVCDAARRGIEAVGVDFAREMVGLASRKAQKEGIKRAKFVCSSVFDLKVLPLRYDLISANGFVEYLSQQEMRDFFDFVAESLAPKGSFVVGSRNRLFNLVSMNEYTLKELEAGSVELLLQEAVKWNNANDIAEALTTECAPFQSVSAERVKTDIDVSKRFQYTPLQLINLLRARGLRPVEVYPVHIHVAPPSFCTVNPTIHASMANLLQTYAWQNTQLLTRASTFMLHVTKEM